MGDVADMMLDGTLCAGCGVVLNGEGDGIPRYCGMCNRDIAAYDKAQQKAANIERNARQKKTKCPYCGKRVKEIGLSMHVDALHSDIQGQE